MSIHNHWRNKQLGDNFLRQELICWEFLNRHLDIVWEWHGINGNFYNFCQQHFNFGASPTGLIMLNTPSRVTPKEFVNKINNLILPTTQAIYLAVNRYEFAAINDLNIDYPESIDQAIELIVQHCCVPFQKINHAIPVDNYHFVGVHGLDIFVYEHNR